jgi:vacuolar-type H+-ATPase subunit H
MYKSEAERVIRKALEETGATFTDEQIEALGKIITKIASQIVEEAFASARSNSSGKSSSFFS